MRNRPGATPATLLQQTALFTTSSIGIVPSDAPTLLPHTHTSSIPSRTSMQLPRPLTTEAKVVARTSSGASRYTATSCSMAFSRKAEVSAKRACPTWPDGCLTVAVLGSRAPESAAPPGPAGVGGEPAAAVAAGSAGMVKCCCAAPAAAARSAASACCSCHCSMTCSGRSRRTML